MSESVLDELITRAEKLQPEEQLELISRLAERVRAGYPNLPRRKWQDLHGAAPALLGGEDAQQWVNRSRSEADSHRRLQ